MPENGGSRDPSHTARSERRASVPAGDVEPRLVSRSRPGTAAPKTLPMPSPDVSSKRTRILTEGSVVTTVTEGADGTRQTVRVLGPGVIVFDAYGIQGMTDSLENLTCHGVPPGTVAAAPESALAAGMNPSISITSYATPQAGKAALIVSRASGMQASYTSNTGGSTYGPRKVRRPPDKID